MQEIKPPSLKFATVRQSVFFRAAPEEVYAAILDPVKRAEWTGQRATGDAKVGSRFTTTDGYVFGKNLELKDGKLIVQEWKTREWPEGSPFSLVKYSLKKQRAGTRLELTHSKVPASLKNYVDQGMG
jgi:activator of HSP90 ATPase